MFLKLSSSAMKHPVRWLIAWIGLTVLCALGLPRLEIRTDGATIHPDDNQTIRMTEQDRSVFRDPEDVILLMTSLQDREPVASPHGLQLLRTIHIELERQAGVERGGVRSLSSLPISPTDEDALSGARLLDTIPEEPESFAELMETIRDHPLTDGLYLSPTGRAAAMYIQLVEEQSPEEFIERLEGWIDSRAGSGFELRLMGPLVAESTLGGIVLRDLLRLVPIMIVVVALMLFVLLRTRGGVLIPLTEAAMVLIWTIGIMGHCGVPVTLVTTVLPVILMAMAITDEIHILEKLQARLAAQSEATGAQQRLTSDVAESLKEVGPPIVTTTLTTALGFLSFLSASMSPMREFGLFASLGIVLAMVMSFTFIPALIVTLPASWFRPGKPRSPESADRETESGGRPPFWLGSRGTIIGLLLLAIAIPGLLRLSVQDSWLDNFDPDSKLVSAQSEFDTEFWGSYRFDIVFEGEKDLFASPKGVALLDKLERRASELTNVGGVVSFLVPLRPVAQVLGGNDSIAELSTGQITDAITIARMWAGDGEMDRLLVPDYSTTRVRLFVSDADYRRAVSLHSDLSRIVDDLVAETAVSYHFSGDLPVAIEVVRATVTNQLRSIGWVLACILLLLLIVLRPFVAALIVMIPVLTADLLIFALMGYSGLPIGIATSMFAAITIGVGVDYALHLLHSYRKHRSVELDHRKSLAAALAGTGRAIRWNALVLAAGFLVLSFSAVHPNRSLGFLLSSAMLACLLTTLLFLPALLRRLPLVAILVCLAVPAAAQVDSRSYAQQAPEIMRRLQDDFQRTPRIVRMEVSSEYLDRGESERVLWGLLDGGDRAFRVLYVFTHPEGSKGTSLLMKLASSPDAPDSSWFYLPSFHSLRQVDETAYRLLVPGTGLNYGDARGYLPVDEYDFELVEPGSGSDTAVVAISAKPRTRRIRTNAGYDSLAIWIDSEKMLIVRIDYTALDGEPLKRYEVTESVLVNEVWHPQKVLISHFTEDLVSETGYRYWPLSDAVPDTIYAPTLLTAPFLDRLNQLLQENEIDPGVEIR